MDFTVQQFLNKFHRHNEAETRTAYDVRTWYDARASDQRTRKDKDRVGVHHMSSEGVLDLGLPKDFAAMRAARAHFGC